MTTFVTAPVHDMVFDAAVNELLDEKLGPNRHSRCLVPQPDGTKKVCPKVKDGNHAPCATCPHKGEFERENKSMVSIETLNEDEYHPMQAAPSAETEALEMAIITSSEHTRSHSSQIYFRSPCDILRIYQQSHIPSAPEDTSFPDGMSVSSSVDGFFLQ